MWRRADSRAPIALLALVAIAACAPQAALFEAPSPRSADRSVRIFTVKEVEIVAAPLTRALREHDAVHIHLNDLADQGRSAPLGFFGSVSPTLTKVSLRCSPPGSLLGVEKRPRVNWTFEQVDGLRFRGKPGVKIGYYRLGADRYDYMVVFPRAAADTSYWSAAFRF